VLRPASEFQPGDIDICARSAAYNGVAVWRCLGRIGYGRWGPPFVPGFMVASHRRSFILDGAKDLAGPERNRRSNRQGADGEPGRSTNSAPAKSPSRQTSLQRSAVVKPSSEIMNLTGSRGRRECSRIPMPRSEASRIVNEQMSFRMRRRAPQLDDVRSNALLSNSFSRSPNVVISRSYSHPRPRKMSGQDANHGAAHVAIEICS
jgi:hypothetical protein